MGTKDVSIGFGNCSGGLNSRDPAISLAENEVQYCRNAMFRPKGINRAPGFLGLAASAIFSDMNGLFEYLLYSGTDYLIAVSGGKVYQINKTTGAKGTVLYDLTGSGECYASMYLNKLWLCNGAKTAKVESDLSTYQIGITKPTGASAAAAAGGTLPDGNYIVYISYSRKVSGTTYLYSEGMSLGTITLGGGNNTVRISNFAASADVQVTNKIIWLSDANGDTVYFYQENANDATTTINVTSNATRNNNLVYQVVAQQNQLPGALEFIYSYDNRLFGSINNVCYYSLKGNNIAGSPVYDLERWPTLNALNMPFKIISMFGLNGDLFFNTVGGVIRQPSADVTARYQHMTNGLYFLEPRTVKEYNGVVWGLTNDGFRYFDGQKFSIDLSKKIKPDIKRCYTGIGTGFRAAGEIYRRSAIRTEYHLSFRDLNVSSKCNNMTYVLNIDAVAIQDENVFHAPWEVWEGGFGYSCVDQSNEIYKGQSLASSGTIYKEQLSNGSNADQYVYDKSGTFLSTLTKKGLVVWSRTVLQYITAMLELQTLHVLALLSQDGTVSIVIADKYLTSQDNTINSLTNTTGAAIYDKSLYDVAVYPSESPMITLSKLGQKLKGRSFFVKISQTDDDNSFNIQDIIVSGIAESGRFI